MGAVCRTVAGVLGWTLLIPVKPLPRAKSRLQPATADAAAHARLVNAIRRDTQTAAQSARGVNRIVVVDAPGLNAALRAAEADARRQYPDDGIAALVGDLPALRAADLAAALAEAARHPRAFVPDTGGTGTTLLTARPGVALAPAFGPGSAARHGASATRLAAAPGLRCDVDTAADLVLATTLGTGRATTDVLGAPGPQRTARREGVVHQQQA
jgi:2-phospho-L-lactate guanylyltransferase